jgi:galactose mutarotase-like enzyme
MSAKGGHEVSRAVEHGVDIYTLRAGEARARVAPAWGANLFCWSDGAAILEPVPLDEVARKPTSYGIPLLLPFPNRVAGGAFTFAGRRYEVDPPRHGFVRARPWAVQDCGASDDGGAWIRCAIDTADFPELAAQYPSTLRAVVSHRLRDRTLNLHVDATNTGDQVMPFGFGIHPYFRRRGAGSSPTACRPASASRSTRRPTSGSRARSATSSSTTSTPTWRPATTVGSAACSPTPTPASAPSSRPTARCSPTR